MSAATVTKEVQGVLSKAAFCQLHSPTYHLPPVPVRLLSYFPSNPSKTTADNWRGPCAHHNWGHNNADAQAHAGCHQHRPVPFCGVDGDRAIDSGWVHLPTHSSVRAAAHR